MGGRKALIRARLREDGVDIEGGREGRALIGKVMSDGSTFAMTLSNVVYHSTTLMISYLYVHT